MNFRNYLIDAIEVVLAWSDIPDDAFAIAVMTQASLMARGSPEDIGVSRSD